MNGLPPQITSNVQPAPPTQVNGRLLIELLAACGVPDLRRIEGLEYDPIGSKLIIRRSRQDEAGLFVKDAQGQRLVETFEIIVAGSR